MLVLRLAYNAMGASTCIMHLCELAALDSTQGHGGNSIRSNISMWLCCLKKQTRRRKYNSRLLTILNCRHSLSFLDQQFHYYDTNVFSFEGVAPCLYK